MYINLWCLFLLAAGCPLLVAENYEKFSNQAEKGFSTSTYAMIELLRMEQYLVKQLRSYAEELQRKTALIKSGLKIMKNIRVSIKSLKHFRKNPLRKFTLIRQMHMDWKKWLQYLSQDVGSLELKHIKESQKYRPKYTDLVEARKGMLRIRMIYELTELDMADGLLNGMQYESKLQVYDRFDIGLGAFDSGDFFSASHWFYTAILIFESDNERIYKIRGLHFNDLYLLYMESLLKHNLYEMVLLITRQLMEDYLQYNMELQRRRANWLRHFYTEPKASNLQDILRRDAYDIVCSQNERPIDRKLFCRYNRDFTAFLKLAPIKMEQLSHKPFIVLYHDVIYDSEIEEFKADAIPIMVRAKTIDVETKEEDLDDGRTSNTAFLFNDNSSASRRVHRRLADMTGLAMCCGENFSVMNYGIGGHYGPHCDFFKVTDELRANRKLPERFATVLFYLNDIERGGGGGTAFPLLNINVRPKKGAALFWHNLDNAGNGNMFTTHYACPVLVGSKWVMSKWIDEFSQMFVKPCLKVE